jgi:glycosyltransferase 2 family protein
VRGRGSRWTRVRNTVVSDIRNGVLRRNALPAVVLASIGVTLGHAATFVVAARTTGTDAPLSRLLPLAMLALLAMVLPSIAGWGPREGATAWVFAAAGLGAAHGAATAVAFGVLVLAASLPGAIVLLVGWWPQRRASKARPRRRVLLGPEGAADA